MITFRSSILIKVPPEVVFDMLANVHRVKQAPDSPVLLLELITPGPPGVGSRYHEVVRMLPFYDGEIISEITAFEPPRLLEPLIRRMLISRLEWRLGTIQRGMEQGIELEDA